MKRYLILLFFICLLFKQQINAQCLNDPFVGWTTIPQSSNECATSFFDGPMPISNLTGIPGNDWMLIIDEGFDGPLDSTIWLPTDPSGNDESAGGYTGANALIIPENLSVYNSALHLRGMYNNDPTKLYHRFGTFGGTWSDTWVHRDYTAGGLVSRYNFPLNAHFQISAKMFPNPNVTPSAIWMYNAGQEIDIQELYTGLLSENYNLPHHSSVMSMGVHGTAYGADYATNPIASEYTYT